MDFSDVNPKELPKEEVKNIVENLAAVNAANVKTIQGVASENSIDLITGLEDQLSEIYKPLAREGAKRTRAEQKRLDKLLISVRDEASRMHQTEYGRVKNLVESLQPKKEESNDLDIDFGLVGSSSRNTSEVSGRPLRELPASVEEASTRPLQSGLPGNSGTATFTITGPGEDPEGQTSYPVDGRPTQTTQGVSTRLLGPSLPTGGFPPKPPQDFPPVSLPDDPTYGGGVVIMPPPDYDGPPLDWKNCKKTATGWYCPPIPPPKPCYDPPPPKPVPFPFPEPTCPKPETEQCPDGQDWAWNKQSGKWVCSPGGIPPDQLPKPMPPVPSCEDMYRQVQFNMPIDCGMLPEHFKKQLLDCGFNVCPDTAKVPTGMPPPLSAEWTELLVRVILSIGWVFH